MRLINVKALLERESSLRNGRRVDHRARVLEFGDDEVTKYAILSHRWIEQEVEYDEIVKLAKMDMENRDEIRQRDGYRKILDSCMQAEKDGYEWLWVDTCCIDKGRSAELSLAINSMYRWYENAKVCYAYLHDVLDPSFPVARNNERYATGWPEWFLRGWTLQEMIAPSNVQFFNKKWQAIGDKRTLAPILKNITGVPEPILTRGLPGNRPCVAQIMSWAANRTTTQVEDRAYSLMGLLDVNMPMLYGEGKYAFHRLQLEIMRKSNDQSIFAWGWGNQSLFAWRWGEVRTRCILADDPCFFRGCDEMELMDRDEFIESRREHIPEEELGCIKNDQLGAFSITNRGIQIWLFLCPIRGSHSAFQACLPCRSGPWNPPVTINLRLWESNYYRCVRMEFCPERTSQFRQVYLGIGDPEVLLMQEKLAKAERRQHEITPGEGLYSQFQKILQGKKVIIMQLSAEAKRQQDLALVKELEVEYKRAEAEQQDSERWEDIVKFWKMTALPQKETVPVFMPAVDAIVGLIDKLRSKVDFDMAIRLGRVFVAVCIPGHPHRSSSLRKLIDLLTERFQEQDAISDLDELVILHRDILDLHPPDDKARPPLLRDSAHHLWSRFQRQGRTCDLEAITFECAALQLHQHDHADHVKSFHNAVRYHGELRKTGKAADVAKLIALGRTVLELDPSDRAHYASSLQELALWVSEGFNQQAVTVDMQEAITLTDSVLTLCPTDHLDRPVLLKAIATYRRKKFKSHVKGGIVDRVKKRIGVAAYDTLKTLPTRLLNTLTGRLCGRDELMLDFENSAQYKELLGLATNSYPPHMWKTISSYFQYATLSHRWGSDEPVLHDFQDRAIYKMELPHGIIKLQSFCAEASTRGYRWAWSDTCCIDKENSAELQEAIGSMFRCTV